MMDGIRIELSLQAVSMSGPVCTATFTGMILTNVIGGVKMNAGHRGVHTHGNAGQIRYSNGCRTQISNIAVDDIVVIISFCLQQLREKMNQKNVYCMNPAFDI